MDLLNKRNLLQVINDINSQENKNRKNISNRECRIYRGNLHQYVVEELRKSFQQHTVSQMPIESNLNIARRMCQEVASIYREAPNREFVDVTDKQKDVLDAIYEDTMMNFKLLNANEYFVLQRQAMVQVFPHEGKLKVRLLNPHHFDVIPGEDPEEAIGVIISAFDNTYKEYDELDNTRYSGYQNSNPDRVHQSDRINQSIGDDDDSEALKERYVVWTKKYTMMDGTECPAYNFICDGRGNILSKDVYSPIDELPFIDISGMKNFKFWVDENSGLADFTVKFNAVLSEIGMNIRNQAWSQAYLKASERYLEAIKDLEVGPTKIIFLPIDPEEPGADPEFGFASPGGDLKINLEYAQSLLSTFLTSNGLDPDVISNDGSSKIYNSGFERFLAQLQRFSASKQDIDTFQKVEQKMFKLVKLWHNVAKKENLLDDKYLAEDFTGDESLSVKYVSPEAVQTKAEQIAYHQAMMDSGLSSRVTAIMEIKNMTEDQAKRYLEKVDEQKNTYNVKDMAEPQVILSEEDVVEEQPIEEENDADTEA